MDPEFAPRPATPFVLYGTVGLVGLALVYLLVGTIGHDPWRGDDSVYFGVVHGMLHGAGWLVPQVAGEPLFDYPPLYYWVSALCAELTAWALPEHDGARLASALFCGSALLALSRAALVFWGREALAPAGLLVLGCLGLVIYAHETQPLLSLLAGQSLALFGVAALIERPVKGGIWLGIGLAVSFLGTGFSGLLPSLPVLLALPWMPAWSRRRWAGVLLAILCALALSLPWPLVLHAEAPQAFDAWWLQEMSDLRLRAGWAEDGAEVLRNIGWFTWPLWPLAVWQVYRGRRQWCHPGYLAPLLCLLPALLFPVLGSGLRPTQMLPVLPPLAILASAGASGLRRGAANAFNWFAIMSFGVFATLVWLAWSAMATAWPPGLGRQLAKLAPGFEMEALLVPLSLGVAICAAWVTVLMALPRSPVRPSFNWALGMTMLWSLAVSLLMPWFQHGKTYRPAAESLAHALADRRGACVAMDGVSLSQRASFDYFAGLRFQPVDGKGSGCPLRLVFRERQRKVPAPGENWSPIWSFQRGGGKQLESFVLYRRSDPGDSDNDVSSMQQ